MFNGKSIFISGCTGSFGRNFIRRLLEQYHPKRVVVFSLDELKQYEMQQAFNAPCMRYFLGEALILQIPSSRIFSLVAGVSGHLLQKNIGIHPGEKLHELIEQCGRMDEDFEYRFDTNPQLISGGQIVNLCAQLSA